jgi:hypothetical protein
MINLNFLTQDFSDLVSTMSLACGYWVDDMEVDGKTIDLLDVEGDTHTITLADIRKAVNSIVSDATQVAGDIQDDLRLAISERDLGQVDGYAADAILQVATYGEIVYG